MTAAERKRRSRQRERIYPDIRFDVIYADPPWRYAYQAKREEDRIESHYPTMALGEIKEIRFKTAKTAVCFLWATNPLLPEALAVLDYWGFQYKSNLAWDKKIPGLGYWVRGQHELLLMGTKNGFPTPPPSMRLPSVYVCKRGQHSEKPFYIRDYITNLYPDLKKLELFARPDMFRGEYEDKGWYFWGN